MSLPPPDGYAAFAATFTQTTSGRNAVITLGVNPAPGATAAGTLSNVSAALFGATFLYDVDFLDASWSLTQEYCLLNTGGVLTSDTQIVSVPGTVAGTCPTPNVSIVVNKRTALAGRAFRGRNAMPAGYLTEGNVSDEGIIAGAYLTDLNAAATGTLAELSSNGVPMVILHGPPLGGGATPAPTAVTSLTVSALVGTQRRRLRR